MVFFGRLYIKWLPSAPMKPVKVTYDGRTRVVVLRTVNQSFGPGADASSGFLYYPMGRILDLGKEFPLDAYQVIPMDCLKAAHIERHSGKPDDSKNASNSSTEAQA